MKTYLILPILFFSLISVSIQSQDVQIDSLKRIIEQSPGDTSKVNSMLVLSGKLCRVNPIEAVGIATEAKNLAEQINFDKGLAYALKAIGMAYYFQSDYTNVLVFWQLSLERFKSIDDKLGIANMLNNLGAVYYNGGDDNKAVDFYIQSLRVSEQIGDTLRIATALVNIGAVYYNKPATHARALEYYKRALPLSEMLEDNDAIGTTSVNMGEIYFERNEYDSALIYYERSLEAYQNSETGNLPYTLNNIGNVYAQKGEIKKAINYQKEAFDIAEFRKDKLEMAHALMGLANTYLLSDDIYASNNYFIRAQVIAEEISADYELLDIYEGLAHNYEKVNDFENAFEYHKAYASVKDSIYNSDMDKRITSATLSYDIEKKQGQIDLMTKEKELRELTIKQQKLLRNALIIFLVLVLIITIGAIRNYLNKVKVNKKLDKQKDEIEGLLLNILPEKVAKELQVNGHAKPRSYENVTVLFTDFKDFTKISSGMTPEDLVEELSTFFQAFDSIIEAHNLEKIKTIGDAYMCAGGIPETNNTHPVDAIKAGLAMQEFMESNNKKLLAEGKPTWNLRVGIHTGPLVAGVVGKKKYAYDIWGSAVNLASRMESNGEAGKVNISAITYELVKDQFECHYRGKISAKNVGEVDMYFIESKIQMKITGNDQSKQEEIVTQKIS